MNRATPTHPTEPFTEQPATPSPCRRPDKLPCRDVTLHRGAEPYITAQNLPSRRRTFHRPGEPSIGAGKFASPRRRLQRPVELYVAVQNLTLPRRTLHRPGEPCIAPGKSTLRRRILHRGAEPCTAAQIFAPPPGCPSPPPLARSGEPVLPAPLYKLPQTPCFLTTGSRQVSCHRDRLQRFADFHQQALGISAPGVSSAACNRPERDASAEVFLENLLRTAATGSKVAAVHPVTRQRLGRTRVDAGGVPEPLAFAHPRSRVLHIDPGTALPGI